MNAAEALRKLKSAGTAQNRKVYARHGVGDKMFGVSYANLGKLKQQIKQDHALAVALWESGNHDARVLATMIADPAKMTSRDLDKWVKDLDNYVLTDAFSGLAAGTRHAEKKLEKWTRSKNEWIGACGWNLVCHLALTPDTPDEFFLPYLEMIASEIQKRKNRVRHAMNATLISIGMRGGKLEDKALAVSRMIGTVEVDHGETSCKTPDAAEYIRRARMRLG